MDDVLKQIWRFLPLVILAFFIYVAVFSTGLYRTVTLFIIFGGLLGWLRASRRGGNLADKYQWSAVHALILMIVGFFVGIIAA